MRNALIIDDYFESLVNQVDCKAEALINENYSITWLVDKINERRMLYNEGIRKIKEENLKKLSNKKIKLDNEPRSEEELREQLFSPFCFLLDTDDINVPNEEFRLQKWTLVDRTFGYLIILPCYVKTEKLNIYRKFSKCFNHFITNRPPLKDTNVFNFMSKNNVN